MQITIKTNDTWNSGIPFFTIITPVYNRSNIVKRTFSSVENQIFRDFEYIIIDDGSTDNLDVIVNEFMQNTKIPVMYIKKENGGVHTARNIGIKNGKGTLLIMIDSDDELKEDCLQNAYNEWQKIPEDERKYYFQMKRTL